MSYQYINISQGSRVDLDARDGREGKESGIKTNEQVFEYLIYPGKMLILFPSDIKKPLPHENTM